MPIKRSPEEGSRPPLSRGSACHRCFARKVRCSGQPSPESGLHACTSCLRTARFKGHELAHARCAFHGEGLCSEEGGPSMTGEIYSNVGPAPRRKLTSRSSTTTSVSSTRSAASAMSNATDYSFETPGAPSLISPVSSTTSLKSMGDHAPSVSASPETLVFPPPTTYQLPPALPQYTMSSNAHAYAFAPSHYPPSTTCSLPPTPLHPSSPFPGATRTASDTTCPKSLLSRRTKAAPMSISLPPQSAMVPSPTVSRVPSPVLHLASTSNSAPLAMPQSWGAPPPPLQHQHQQHERYGQPTGLYLQQQAPQDDLSGAMQSVLTPSTLAKLPTAQVAYGFPTPAHSYQAAYGLGPAATPSHGYTGAEQLMSYGSGGGHSSVNVALPPTPMRSLSVSELYPPSAYAQGHHNAGTEYDAGASVGWGTSFHLPSPGLTFTSSTPHWLAHGGGAAAQYFQV
ncbi:hypothetical protein JCM3770_003810 [Rhodotorula araucariae]